MGTLAWLGIVALALALIAIGLILIAGRGGSLPTVGILRMARLSRFAAGFSASWIGAKLRRAVANKDKRIQIDEATRERNAKRLADTMGNMKGAFMKLGQMLSFITDALPKEYQTSLALLQAEAPSLDFPSIRDALETELGKPLERAFSDFDESPIAAASIGQVHRATLPDGRIVAVKVQYPGIAKAIRSDLANVGMLYRMIGVLYPALDPKPVVDELRTRIGEELDYIYEAQNQRNFRQLYHGHPVFRIPEIIDNYTTKRVLTSEFISGKRFSQLSELSQEQRNRYGEILYRFAFGTTLRFRAFNGDPHPGNYLFDDQGRIVFLDFGLTKYFPAAMIKPWREAVLAYMRKDREGFAAQLTELAFVRPDTDISPGTLYDYFTYFYDCWRTDREFTFTDEYNAKSFEMIFKPKGEFEGIQKKLNMPQDFVFINRIQWGVMSLLAKLDACANWHQIHCEYMLGSPPATEIGEQIAAWREQWLRGRNRDNRELYLTASGLNDEDPGDFPFCGSA